MMMKEKKHMKRTKEKKTTTAAYCKLKSMLRFHQQFENGAIDEQLRSN